MNNWNVSRINWFQFQKRPPEALPVENATRKVMSGWRIKEGKTTTSERRKYEERKLKGIITSRLKLSRSVRVRTRRNRKAGKAKRERALLAKISPRNLAFPCHSRSWDGNRNFSHSRSLWFGRHFRETNFFSSGVNYASRRCEFSFFFFFYSPFGISCELLESYWY